MRYGDLMKTTTTDLEEADHLYGSARDMLHAAQVLSERNRLRGEHRFEGTTYFLLGFVVELFLKSYLAQKGAGQQARKKLGHDLRSAFAEAEAVGLAFPEREQLNVLVESLSDAHQQLSFRYSVPGATISVPQPVGACLTLLDRLDDHVRAGVNVKAAARLSLGEG